MTQAQHTPGRPWTVEQVGSQYYITYRGEDRGTFEVAITKREDYARLIASAPETHSILSDMVLAYSPVTTEDEWMDLAARYCNHDFPTTEGIKKAIHEAAARIVRKTKGLAV